MLTCYVFFLSINYKIRFHDWERSGTILRDMVHVVDANLDQKSWNWFPYTLFDRKGVRHCIKTWSSIRIRLQKTFEILLKQIEHKSCLHAVPSMCTCVFSLSSFLIEFSLSIRSIFAVCLLQFMYKLECRCCSLLLLYNF